MAQVITHDVRHELTTSPNDKPTSSCTGASLPTGDRWARQVCRAAHRLERLPRSSSRQTSGRCRPWVHARGGGSRSHRWPAGGDRPRVGAYVVAGWLVAIIVNLLMSGRYFDIALRDFGLMLGALALGRLAQVYDRHQTN